MRCNFIVLILALFGLVPSVHCFAGAVSDDSAEVTFQSAVLPFLAKNCFACHGNGESKADLSLDKYKDDLSLIMDRKVWDNVVNMLEKHEMPHRKVHNLPPKTLIASSKPSIPFCRISIVVSQAANPTRAA